MKDKIYNNFFAGGANHPFILYDFYPQIKSANGPYLITKNNEQLIDLWMGFGSVIIGHSHKDFINYLLSQLTNGIMIPSISKEEMELSKLLVNIIPSAEKIKLALTGTEVVNYAVKLAKYITQREKILTINGSYHGSTLSFPDKILEKYIDKVEFNDFESIEKKLESEEYAALILEPVMCNKGIILPEENYLKFLKKLCKSSGTILIFDEVVTGFRIKLGGAQEYYKVKPNISTFGKSMGNGIPISSIVGEKTLMDNFMPKGKIFFGGTFYSNLVSISAALYTLKFLKKNFKKLLNISHYIVNGIKDCINDLKINITLSNIGSVFYIFFSENSPRNYLEFLKYEKYGRKVYEEFVKIALRKGLFLPSLHTEPMFISFAHEEVKDKIVEGMYESLKELTWCILCGKEKDMRI